MIHRPQSSLIRRRFQRGFSLAEVLLAVLIASLCATLLVSTMPTANANRAKSTNQNKAMSLAVKQMEAIRGLGYPNVSAKQLTANGLLDSEATCGTPNTYSFTNVDNTAFDNPSVVLPEGQGYVQIHQIDLDLKRVVIEVRWKDGMQFKSVFLGSMIANL